MEGKWTESGLMQPVQQSGQTRYATSTGFSLSLLLYIFEERRRVVDIERSIKYVLGTLAVN